MQAEMSYQISRTVKEDLSGIKSILETIELFPPEMLEEMIADFLENPNSNALWLTYSENEIPLGFVFCNIEMLTDGTYNMYAIGVKNYQQGKGIGAKLVNAVETQLRTKGGRVLIVDTSSTDEFGATRNFYLKNGYEKEAVIRDFWAEGDDKVVFRKKLA